MNKKTVSSHFLILNCIYEPQNFYTLFNFLAKCIKFHFSQHIFKVHSFK